MSDPLAVSYEQAAENHLRDALAMSHARRWQWLTQAMDLGFAIARSRASRGLASVDANSVRLDVQYVGGTDDETPMTAVRKRARNRSCCSPGSALGVWYIS